MKKIFVICIVVLLNLATCFKQTLTSEEKDRFKNAIYTNDIAYISEILESRKLDLNDEDVFDGYLPVQLAVMRNNLKLVELFISYGSDINKKDKKVQKTCVHYVLNPEMLNFLISNGLNLNAQDHMGYTGLHRVSIDVFLPVMEVFIKSGADIEIKNDYGQTPIFMSVQGKNYNAFMLLVKSGAKLDVYTDRNANILHYYASAPEDKRIFSEIMKRNPGLLYDNDNDVLCLMMATSGTERSLNIRKQFISTLLSMGININKQDRTGSTVLHRAAISDRKDMVIFLLKSGSNKSIKNNEGMTSLDYAIKNKNNELIKILMSNE